MLCPSPISKARTEDALLLSSSFFLSPSCSPPRQEGRLLPSLNSSSPLYNTLQTQFFTVAGFIQKHAFQAKKNPLCFLVNFFFTLRFPLWTLCPSQRSAPRGVENRQWLSCKLVLMLDWSGTLPREPLLIARMKVSGSFASLAWGLSWQKCKFFVALD